jgi:hypothetical protein
MRPSGPPWVLDYDIPVDPKAKGMAFYRGLWRILGENEIVSSNCESGNISKLS